MELRVWWIREVPNEPEYFKVGNIDEAMAKLKELEMADLANRFIQTNAGGLEIFEDGEWTEYYDDQGRDIDGIVLDLEQVKEGKDA